MVRKALRPKLYIKRTLYIFLKCSHIYRNACVFLPLSFKIISNASERLFFTIVQKKEIKNFESNKQRNRCLPSAFANSVILLFVLFCIKLIV